MAGADELSLADTKSMLAGGQNSRRGLHHGEPWLLHEHLR